MQETPKMARKLKELSSQVVIITCQEPLKIAKLWYIAHFVALF